MTNTEEIIKDIEPLIREKVRAIIIRKLSIWDARASITNIIGEETENFMKVIRPALWRTEKWTLTND